MKKTYDVIVVGAGIAGCSSAYFLHQKGLKVLVIDRSGVAAAGGSSAAGAFVSPKIGKGSPLQQLTNEAFAFAKDFYRQHFSNHFHQTGVIRIPKIPWMPKILRLCSPQMRHHGMGISKRA